MALSDYRINSFTKPVSALDDKPQMSAAQLKEWFDSNSTKELKESVNGLIDELGEVLSDKVDKVTGMGLSSNDYTDEDKAKVHTHANKAILDKITAAYTTAEKAKLSGIEEGANNYTHPESHSADMITETASKRFTSDTELSDKVDKVTGKGLSSNDYTDEDKAKVHEHANKAVLDAITEAPIPDAPSDSSVYGRKNGAWSKILQSLPEVAYADLDDFCPINDDDSNFGTYTGIYKVYKTDDGSENFSWGQIPYRNRDAYVLAVSEYSYDNNVTCTQTLYGANALPRQRVKQIASGSTKSENEWTDWSGVTYTKYEINQLINPTVKNTLTSPITANTIYNLGKQTALTINLPSASVGKFVQFDFVSGSTATTLTVNSSSGLTDFDLIPATNTVYSLYFDWGAIGYSGTSVTYGWRFSYSEYPIASV